MDRLRIDKWLWAARFYKTRSLAADELDRGRVMVNGLVAKPSREIKVGDEIRLRQGNAPRTVVVQVISDKRGGAPVAVTLYEETAASVQARLNAAQMRRLAPEPALSQNQGRPTKRDRRDTDRIKQHGWDARWSASLD